MSGNRGRRNLRQDSGSWLAPGIKRLAVVVFACGSLFWPLRAGAGESLGIARVAGTAMRNGAPLSNGSIVFSGDVVSTGARSALRLESSKGERVWLGANTRVHLADNAGTVVVALREGAVGVACRGHVQVTMAGGGMALSWRAGPSPVLAQLARVNSDQAQLWLGKGTIEIEQDGHDVRLEAGPSGLVSSVGGGPRLASPSRSLAPQLASGEGGLEGSIVNTSLASVSGATITLTNTAGATYKATSAAGGSFRFDNLPPGTYTLSVAAPGYLTYRMDHVIVVSGKLSSVYVELKEGARAGMHKGVVIGVVGGAAAALGIGLGSALTGGKHTVSGSTIE